MNALDECGYRLRLAEGFLAEAIQDQELERWRSCVSNAQLSVENAGKAVLAIFGVPPRTHDPAAQIVQLSEKEDVDDRIQQKLRQIVPHLLTLGSREHFLTDYGDESEYVSPWDLFTAASAEQAIGAARASMEAARELIEILEKQRGQDET